MHTHHEILVQAADADEAAAAVEEALEGCGDGDVWDWYVIGGRWSGWHTMMKVGDDDSWPMDRDQYRDGGYDDDLLCYKDDPELFRKCIENQLEAQRGELQRHLEAIPEEQRQRLATGDLVISHDAHDSDDRGDYGMFGHRLYHIGKLIAGYYDFGSYFYNAWWGGPEMPQQTWDEIEKDPDQWWLVTVDLHN